MSKINREIPVFIIFLTLVIIILFFGNVSLSTHISAHQTQESNVAGLLIQFRDGITEPEVKSVLEEYNLTMYKLNYNVDLPDQYYTIVDEDKIMDVRNELGEVENWTEFEIKKGNYYIIGVSEQAIHDENFLSILDKYNLQLKKFLWCHIRFDDRPMSGISEEHANELKRELEMNENIFLVAFESIEAISAE